jgi:uncharacterized membrane protein (DUF485 family)
VFEKITDNVEDIQENLESYIKNSIDYHSLHIYKKTTRVLVSVLRLSLLGGVALLFLFFLSFGAAYLIGENIGNIGNGFFIVAGFYVFVFILVVIFGRRQLEKFVLKSTSKTFFND